jgi:hypothetical protein
MNKFIIIFGMFIGFGKYSKQQESLCEQQENWAVLSSNLSHLVRDSIRESRFHDNRVFHQRYHHDDASCFTACK